MTPKTRLQALFSDGQASPLFPGCATAAGDEIAATCLTRFLYQWDYTREQILAWFRVLDWMLRLPEDLDLEFREELIAFEEETQMPYVTSVERIGIQKGRQARRARLRFYCVRLS